MQKLVASRVAFLSHVLLGLGLFSTMLPADLNAAGLECLSDGDCDDGIFCNGVESCDLGTNTCVALSACPPMDPPSVCNEATDSCDPACAMDSDCDDGLFCNGVESCDTESGLCFAVSSCPPGGSPPTECNEVTDTCDPASCVMDSDCDDGIFCNGIESCSLIGGFCVSISSCPVTIPASICVESLDACLSVLIFSDGFELGNTSNWSS